MRLKSDGGKFVAYYFVWTEWEYLYIHVPFCKQCAAAGRPRRAIRLGRFDDRTITLSVKHSQYAMDLARLNGVDARAIAGPIKDTVLLIMAALAVIVGIGILGYLADVLTRR